jgi:hypothetical protein
MCGWYQVHFPDPGVYWLVLKAFPHGNRRLGVMGSVVAVLEAQAVPVHRRVDVAQVQDVEEKLLEVTRIDMRQPAGEGPGTEVVFDWQD